MAKFMPENNAGMKTRKKLFAIDPEEEYQQAYTLYTIADNNYPCQTKS